MAQEVDSLSVKITSESKDATKAVDSLAKSLTRLMDSLKGISTSNVTQGIGNISKTSTSAFTQIASGIREIGASISEIHPENLNNLANVLKSLGDASGVKNATASVREMGRSLSEATAPIEKVKSSLEATSHLSGETSESYAQQAETIKEESNEEKNSIQELIRKINEYKSTIRGMESGKIAFDGDKYREAVKGLQGATEEFDRFKSGFSETTSKSEMFLGSLGRVASISVSIGALSASIGHLSSALDSAGNGLFGFLKLLYKPMDHVVNEYREKFENIVNITKRFGENFKSVIGTIPEFMNKVFQRFSFTILRKAINSVIQDLGTAVQSLRNFTGTVGVEFNNSLTSIQNNLRTLGGSIVAAFAPLVNAVAPIIDFIVDKLVTAINVINQFFAALFGRSTYAVVKATKGVGRYGAAAGKAAEAQEKLNNSVLAFDQLNKLDGNDKNGGAGGGGGGGGAGGAGFEWEELPIDGWIKDLIDKIKDIAKQLFNPIKEAWKRAGNYIISGAKYMAIELGKLFVAIGKDFLKMWQEKATVRMLSNIFRIVGDIEYTVGHLARRFREAWEANNTGLKILERIRDIFATLIDHVRNVTKYMRDWAATINFRPILTTFSELLKSLNKVADFIGGVFEDIMKSVILKYIKWMIEDGFPHLHEQVKSVIDAFDFEKIRSDLSILWDAIETLAENIHTGLANAIGEVGRAFAEWTNSAEFTAFMEGLAKIMSQITAERVQKFFSALGYGILETVKAVGRFVSSEGFQNFIGKLVAWFDSKSAQQLGKYLAAIAKAIMAFKFTSFVGKKLSGFLKFISTISMTANLNKAAHALTGTKTAVGHLGDSLKGFGGGLKNILTSSKDFFGSLSKGNGIMASAKTGLQSLSAGYSEISSKMSGFSKGMLAIGGGAAEIFTITDAMNGLRDGTKSAGAAIGEMAIGVGAAGNAFSSAFGLKGGVIATVTVGLLTFLGNLKKQIREINFEHIGNAIHDALATPGGVSLSEFGKSYEEAFGKVEEASSHAVEKLEEISDTKTSIQDTAYSFNLIVDAVKEGAVEIGAKLPEIKRLFEQLRDDTQKVMDEEYLIITSSIAGAWRDLLVAQGVSVPAAIAQLAGFKADADKEMAELEAEFIALTEAIANTSDDTVKAQLIERLTEVQNKLNELNDTGTDAAQEALDGLSDSVKKAGYSLDISQYVDGYSLNVDRFKADTQDMRTAAEGAVNGIRAMSEGSEAAISDFVHDLQVLGVEGVENFDWSALVGADQATTQKVYHDLAQAYQTYANKIQDELINKIPEIYEKAGKEYDEIPTWARNMTKSEFVHKALQEYRDGTVVPAVEQLGRDFQVAFDKTGESITLYAGNKMDKVMEEAFTVTEMPDMQAFTDPLTFGIKNVLDALSGEINTSFTETKVSVNNGVNELFQSIAEESTTGGQVVTASLDNVVDQINSTWSKIGDTTLSSSVSFDELKNAVSEVSEQMKLSSADTEALNSALVNSDGTAKTAADAYESLKVKLEEAGIDGQEFASLMNDVLPSSILSSVEANNSFKDSVDESMRSVGESVTSYEQLYSSLSQLRDQGTVTSGQFDELKETLVKQHDSGVSASDAYDTVLEHMRNMSNGSSEAVGEMGTNLTTAFDGILADITGFGEELPNSLGEGVKNNISGADPALNEMSEHAVQTIHDGALQFGSPSQTAIDFGKDVVEGFNIGIRDNASTTAPIIQKWMTDVVDKFKELGTQITDSTKTSSVSIQMFATKLASSMTQVNTTLVSTKSSVKDFSNSVNSSFMQMGEGVKAKLNALSKQVTTIFTAMKRSVQTTVMDMVKVVKTNFDTMKNNINTILNAIQNAIKQKFDKMANDVKAKLREMKSAVDKEFNAIRQKIETVLQNTVEIVGTKLNEMKQKFENIDLHTTGENVIKGFLQGMQQSFPGLLDWAQQAAAQIATTFSNALQMGSPSKLFREYGEFTVEGYMIGVKRMIPRNLRLINEWGDKVTDAYAQTVLNSNKMNASPVTLSDTSDFAGDIINGVYDAVAAAMENYSPEITVYSELRTEDEALARSVTRGQKKLDRRYSPVLRY